MRIELTTSAWKAEVLPLNYTRICGCQQQYRSDFSYVTRLLIFRQGNMKILSKKSFIFVKMLSFIYIMLSILYNIFNRECEGDRRHDEK